MFFSLNKKIILSVFIFFIFCFSLFGYSLYSLYISKLQEEQNFLHQKNMQYSELLYKYNVLQNSLNQENFNAPLDSYKPASNKYRQDENERYQIILTNIYLIFICLVLFSAALLSLIFVFHKWIILPIEELSESCGNIRQGKYKHRIAILPKHFPDEFDELAQTFNGMLDNIEENIEKIKQQKNYLQTIIDGIPDGIRVLDTNGRVQLVNQTYKQYFGETQTPVGQICCRLKCVSPCPYKTDTCPLLTSNEHNIKFIQQIENGDNVYVAVNAARINLKNNKPLIIESFRDLSQDIRFSHQQKVSSLVFLSSSIAHEIKNHLGSMRLIFESILNNKLPAAEKKQYLQLLYKQLLECIKVPERLLNLSRGAETPDTLFDSTDSLQDILAVLDYDAKRRGISINTEEYADSLKLQGSETDFKMILLNLCQNAFKAMPQGGTLSISGRQDSKKYAVISIRDTGYGIDKEQIKHIFEPFYTQTASSQSQNIGLGLTIVKSLVHNFNGTIQVKSAPRKGTCFTLKIPTKAKK